MTTTPDDATTALPGRPSVVDLASWQTARDELLVREKASTREGDALAAARPRLLIDGGLDAIPQAMVAQVDGKNKGLPIIDIAASRSERA